MSKTSWLRNLVPPELRDYLFTGNVNPYSKGFPQMMVDCLLIVIDEMSGQSYADLNRLKALTSTGVIYLRRPYGHYAETQIRHASFAATVNDLQSLPDDNESRRFLCFEATRIDYQSPAGARNTGSPAKTSERSTRTTRPSASEAPRRSCSSPISANRSVSTRHSILRRAIL